MFSSSAPICASTPRLTRLPVDRRWFTPALALVPRPGYVMLIDSSRSSLANGHCFYQYLTPDDRIAITGGTQCLTAAGSNAETQNCAPGINSQAFAPTLLFDTDTASSSAASASSTASSTNGGGIIGGGVGSATSSVASATSQVASSASSAAGQLSSSLASVSSSISSAVAGASQSASSAVCKSRILTK